MRKNIILIGYMGCGKTTIGKKLSFRERKGLLDTDKMIESKEKRTISNIFDTDGEDAFRQMETECLKEIMSLKNNYIISSGGGLPLREENRKLLKDLGCVIYLRAKPETIYDRLKYDTTRPLLRGDDPQGKIRDMIEKRGPIYEEACHEIVDVDGKNHEELLQEITQRVKPYFYRRKRREE